MGAIGWGGQVDFAQCVRARESGRGYGAGCRLSDGAGDSCGSSWSRWWLLPH